MIGIDLVETSRIESKLEKLVMGDLFLSGEIAYATSQPNPAENLAGRYAAKEAIIKALGIDGWDPLEVEILGGGEGTGVRLHGAVRERADELGVDVTVSMTHLAQIAGAVALAKSRPD